MPSSLTQQVVYLAGPMSGLKFEDAQAWRSEATESLHKLKDPRTKKPLYHVLNPLRGHADFRGKMFTPTGGFDDDSAAKVDIRRDRYDVLRCDIVYANLLGATKTGKVSIGTVFELVWGVESDKFILVIMEGKQNPHWHSFVRDAASIMVPTQADALEYMATILNVSEVG